MKTIISLICIMLLGAAVGISSEINRAQFDGEVFMQSKNKQVPYTLTIVYEPGIGGDYRNVKSIKLSVNGRDLSIPRAAFEDLRQVHRPWPVYGVGGQPNHVQFKLEGGDASKSYKVTFEFDEKRLIQRTYRMHLEKNPEITHYTEEKKEAEQAASSNR